MMTLFMPSLHDAAEAAKYAQGIRESLGVRILQSDEDIGQNWEYYNIIIPLFWYCLMDMWK